MWTAQSADHRRVNSGQSIGSGSVNLDEATAGSRGRPTTQGRKFWFGGIYLAQLHLALPNVAELRSSAPS